MNGMLHVGSRELFGHSTGPARQSKPDLVSCCTRAPKVSGRDRPAHDYRTALLGPDQVPPVVVNVLEDANDSVWLSPARVDEADNLTFVSGVISRRAVRFQKQAHATAALIADCNAFPLPFWLSRKQVGVCALGSDDNPALVWREHCVFTEPEAKLARITRSHGHNCRRGSR